MVPSVLPICDTFTRGIPVIFDPAQNGCQCLAWKRLYLRKCKTPCSSRISPEMTQPSSDDMNTSVPKISRASTRLWWPLLVSTLRPTLRQLLNTWCYFTETLSNRSGFVSCLSPKGMETSAAAERLLKKATLARSPAMVGSCHTQHNIRTHARPGQRHPRTTLFDRG